MSSEPAVRARVQLWALIAAITFVGAALRVAGARGDLWLDEIWTFRLLEPIRHPSDIVLALPNDNNHVVTTLWLWLVGPQAPPLLARLPAVVCGLACPPVAAWIFARRSAGLAIAAAIVFSCDYAFVHFGSEARGYSGLILATLVAFGAMDAMLTDGIIPRRQVAFAAAVAFGTFSHLTMVEITGILCVWAAVILTIEQGRRGLLTATVSVGLAALAGLLPPLLCLAVSLKSGPLHTGFLTPFTLSAFATGLSRMAGATLGLPDVDPGPGWIAGGLVGGGLLVVALLGFVPWQRRIFYVLALFGVPALHIVVRLPNQQFPRFHLIVAIALALFSIEAWGVASRLAPRFALAIAGAFLVAQGVALSQFLATGRGQFAEAVRMMQAHGPATFAAEPDLQAGETRAVVRWYAGPGLMPAIHPDCAMPPDWLIVARVPYEHPDDGPTRTTGAAACPVVYARLATYPAYGLSGFTWTLYRRP